jgi:hypothetical protein
MRFPIGASGETTVNELIAALLEFPPNAPVHVSCNNMQDAELIVDGTVVLDS